jgi:hypothetical protein
MQLKNDAQVIPFEYFFTEEGDTINAFSLPGVISALQAQYDNWVTDYATELIAMLEHATSLHLMCETETEVGESVLLENSVRHNGEQWIVWMDRDGIRLSYADPEYEGTDSFMWGDLEKEPYLLGQIIADIEVRNLIA